MPSFGNCTGVKAKLLRSFASKSPNRNRRPTRYAGLRMRTYAFYLDAYQSEISLTEIGSEHYGFDVEDYKMQAGDATDHRRNYMEALKNEPTIIAKGTLTLRPEHLSVIAFDKPGDQRYRSLHQFGDDELAQFALA